MLFVSSEIEVGDAVISRFERFRLNFASWEEGGLD
jgi:hypothetical protein